jgi:ABC-2 type transport system permease protein
VAVGYCVVVTLFADSFDLPGWVRRGSPFAHTPQVPLADLTLTPLIVIVLLAAVGLAAGYAGLRRRDVGY